MRLVEVQRAGTILRDLANRGNAALAKVEPAVRRIVNDVRRRGDRALLKYARRWDGLRETKALKVSQEEIEAAWDESPRDFRAALKTAATNIRRFAEWQQPREWRREIAPGICVGQLVRPLDAVACYVPGGRYPLPSTLLMTVVTAQVAGVREIFVATPRPARETLAAAVLLGIKNVYRIGGAQAVAAFAYGTETVPRVQKIVGPGNLYVTAAKKLVAFDCAIDFLAGPTEAVVAGETGNPEFIAADLVAQAEHDADAVAILVTSSRALALAVKRSVARQSRGNRTASESLRRNGLILLTRSPGETMEIANAIAPEHLTLTADDVGVIRSAGSVFVGDYSPQAAGDYASGPNHVLPTGGTARWRGGLNVLDFVKLITVQQLSLNGLRKASKVVTRLAAAEGLKAHAASIEVRCANA